MRTGPDRSDRAQTALDFAAAMGVFLLALAFVLAFIPSMFAPFFDAGAGSELRGDRAAATLVEAELVEEPGSPAVLDPDAIESFFDGCDEDRLDEILGLAGGVAIEIVDSDGTPYETAGGVQASCGESADETETVSRRLVSIEDDLYTLRVVLG